MIKPVIIKSYFVLYPGISVNKKIIPIVTAVSSVSAFILILLAARCLHLKLRRRQGELHEPVRIACDNLF